MAVKKKKKQKTRKFKTITIKLSVRQKKSLDNYSKVRNTTPLKLIKKAIETFISLAQDMPPPTNYATENQLDLFEEAEKADENNNKD